MSDVDLTPEALGEAERLVTGAYETLSPRDLIDPLPTESAQAYQAWRDYYDLGPGRSLVALEREYQKRALGAPNASQEKGKPKSTVPTTRYATLKAWKTRFRWEERCSARLRVEADIALQRDAKVLKAQKEQRLAEARGLRAAGSKVVEAILLRLKQSPEELMKVPLVGTSKEPGLYYLLREARQAIKLGQDLERRELGEDVNQKFAALIELLIQDMPPEEQAYVRAMAMRVANGVGDEE